MVDERAEQVEAMFELLRTSVIPAFAARLDSTPIDSKENRTLTSYLHNAGVHQRADGT